ncbi:hypothetical protein L1A22_00885 [Pseudomonas extremaustralis]|uniref:hypothetical protein n=1 Tax=Pseudomonas extremaustralis TaxID=359110 RepID=UPI0021C853E0|nr:hypothetical protein [Pseudomonas extremaustralis]UUJ40908.1 hypothetical protein L1A22_00885 [Pseudomonas extremaustralis]
MFTTYPRAEIAFDLPDEPASPAGQRLWSYVEQELLMPWFYIQVVHRSGRENFASMFMMYHAHELKQFIDAQSNRVWVEQVQLVTPPHVNGQPIWLMEPLVKVAIVADPMDGSHCLVYQVASGATYSLRDDLDKNLAPICTLFSEERDLRR